MLDEHCNEIELSQSMLDVKPKCVNGSNVARKYTFIDKFVNKILLYEELKSLKKYCQIQMYCRQREKTIYTYLFTIHVNQIYTLEYVFTLDIAVRIC